MAKSKTVVANMTIHGGTPQKPVIVAEKGAKFDIDADDPENLIGRGIATDLSAAEKPVPDGASVTASEGANVSKQ